MYQILCLISACLSKLSKKNLDRFAYTLAVLSYKVLGVRRSLILYNLDIAFGKEKSRQELEKLGLLSTYHFILTLLEFMAEREGALGEHVELGAGAEYLAEALAQGQGAYILCIHMGSWEAMGSALTRRGYKANVIVKKVGSPAVNRFVTERRLVNGFHPITRLRKGDAVKGILAALTHNEMVGFVMDQARPNEPFLPFFGKPAKTNTSFAAIWRKHPAPIIPVFITRKTVGQHALHVWPPLQLPMTSDTEKDILEHSCIFNTQVEAMIRSCPEQYFWMHNRWKNSESYKQ